MKNRFSSKLGLAFWNSMTVSSRPCWGEPGQWPAAREAVRGPTFCSSAPTLRSEVQGPGQRAADMHRLHHTTSRAHTLASPAKALAVPQSSSGRSPPDPTHTLLPPGPGGPLPPPMPRPLRVNRHEDTAQMLPPLL